jgi:four helix bundle protein
MNDNPLLVKTYSLALEAISVYRALIQRREYVISKQLLRSSTSPGAMAEEAQAAQSTKDFISKLEIAQKEIRESIYWSRILIASDFSSKNELNKLLSLQNECLAIITAIIKSTKRKHS